MLSSIEFRSNVIEIRDIRGILLLADMTIDHLHIVSKPHSFLRFNKFVNIYRRRGKARGGVVESGPATTTVSRRTSPLSSFHFF